MAEESAASATDITAATETPTETDAPAATPAATPADEPLFP